MHGDVHAVCFHIAYDHTFITSLDWQSNVLIDDEGNARLTDLGSEPLVPHIVTGQHRKYGSGGCSYACKSPERIYPEEFGLEEHREPTFACDVYSFAMLCVEVMNELSLLSGGLLTHFHSYTMNNNHLERWTDWQS